MRLILLLLILLVHSALALGQATVYKSVDEQGVVSFSDTPPANPDDAERMQIDTPPASSTGEYEQNLEAMRETTDRMAADRRDREKHRAEMRELQARTNAYQQPDYSDRDYNYDDYTQISGYRGYTGSGYYRPGHPGRPPYRPGYKPKPEHPIARPPHRPGQSDEFGSTRPTRNNSQLMRPITGRR
jgi:hypothetical protein